MMNAFDIATRELGVMEFSGTRDNPRVLEYFTATNLHVSTDEVPWCAAFVNWALKRAGVTGTGKANARSFLDWGEPVSLVCAEQGDIVVLSRGSNEALGHVGFFHSWTSDLRGVRILGGNQSNAVRISTYLSEHIISIRRGA